MSNWKDISTAPKDGTAVLIYARWDWDAMCEPEDEYVALVAVYIGESFWTVTCNPYSDRAYKPTHWQELPPPPEIK